MPIVKTPDGKVIKFPDNMSEQEIISVLDKQSGSGTVTKKESGFVGEMIGNVPGSAIEFGKSMVTPILHPIETATGLKDLSLGLLESLWPGEQGHEKYADAMVDFFKERYGGINEIKETVKKDPVGVLADVSSLLSGLGGASRLAFGKGATLTKALRTGAAVTEPTNIVTKPAGWLTQKVAAPTLAMSSGVESEATKRALQGGPGFRKGLSGTGDLEEMVKSENTALKRLQAIRGAEYTDKLDTISKLSNQLDLTPIQNKLVELMGKKRFNIKVGPKGAYDFSRTAFQKSEIPMVESIINKIRTWGSQTDDLTPFGVDTLKKQLDNFYSDDKISSAFVSELRNEVKDVLVSGVPEYKNMVSGYEKATEKIEQIEKSLKLGDRKSIEGAMKSLMASLRDDNEFRRGFVESLEQVAGKDILNQLAGYQMRTITPRSGHAGLGGRILAGGVFSAIYGMSPATVAIIASSSPKLVGEFLYGVGKAINLEKKVPTGAKNVLFQTGRGEEEKKQKIKWLTPQQQADQP